jgi:murein DD-endopeptidase MepM/ murein hydrolase activator NlpD
MLVNTTNMTRLELGEVIFKVTAITLLAFLILTGYRTVANKLQSNKSDIAITSASIANRIALPFRIAQLSRKPVKNELPVPVYGVNLEQITDTWNAARAEGRTHEGVDIFADRDTPVFSATRGYVTELNIGDRGGTNVMVVGPGGLYYYYAHLNRIAKGVRPGEYVTQDTVLGYVGNTGNATGTPPHLHFGIYPEMWEAINPYPKLVDRWSNQ